MARVTVEDCLKFVDTHYDLVLKASKRARDISDGAPILVEEDNDKPIVIALREIAEDVSAEEVLGASAEGSELPEAEELTFEQDQDQSQEPLEISIN